MSRKKTIWSLKDTNRKKNSKQIILISSRNGEEINLNLNRFVYLCNDNRHKDLFYIKRANKKVIELKKKLINHRNESGECVVFQTWSWQKETQPAG